MSGFAGHACYPTFYAVMKEKKDFYRAVDISHSFATVLYLFVGVCGYFMFGEQVDSLIIFNLDDDAYPHVLFVITLVLTVVNPVTKYPLTLYPVLQEAENLCFGESLRESGQEEEEEEALLEEDSTLTTRLDIAVRDDKQQRRRSQLKHAIMRILLRSFISSLVLLVAIFFPEFEQVLGLLGSLFSLTNSVLFPLACYVSFFPYRSGDYLKYSVEDGGLRGGVGEADDLEDGVEGWKRISAIIGFIFFFLLCVAGTSASFLRSWILELT
jgi:vesicular inhibitory amino acid transporter